MDWLLRNTTRFIKSLNDRFVGNVKLQLAIAKELIIRLESARDRRALAAHKERLKQDMKLLWMKEKVTHPPASSMLTQMLAGGRIASTMLPKMEESWLQRKARLRRSTTSTRSCWVRHCHALVPSTLACWTCHD
jgi:hypothetical protein